MQLRHATTLVPVPSGWVRAMRRKVNILLARSRGQRSGSNAARGAATFKLGTAARRRDLASLKCASQYLGPDATSIEYLNRPLAAGGSLKTFGAPGSHRLPGDSC